MRLDAILLLQSFVFMLLNDVRAEIAHFWHVTDLRYDVHYPSHHDNQRYHSGNEMMGSGIPGFQQGDMGPGPGGGSNPRHPGLFGDFYHDSPWRLLQSAADAMKTIAKDVEFVLWTGDSPAPEAHGATRNMTQLLRHVFSEPFVFPVLGPGSLHNERLFHAAGELWRNWLPEEIMPTFRRGGYYIIEGKKWKIRIIALNTNLWSDMSSDHSAVIGGPAASRRGRGEVQDHRGHSRSRDYLHSGHDGVHGGRTAVRESRENRPQEDPAGQWHWLEDALNKARRDDKLVYLVGNTAPGVDERSTRTPIGQNALYDSHNKRFLQVVRKHADVIAGQFFGHRHSDTFRIIYNSTGFPVSWQLIAPSVSPKRTESGEANNPAIRLYRFDTKTGQILDYFQHYLDLRHANKVGKAEWKLEYNFTQYYDLRDVTPKSLHDLAESFRTSEGYVWFERYFRANSVKLYSEKPSHVGCNMQCLQTHYCAITRLDYSEYRSCLKTPEAARSASAAPRNHRPSSANAAVAISGALLALAFSSTYLRQNFACRKS